MKNAESRKRFSLGAATSGAVVALGGFAVFAIVVLMTMLIAGIEPRTISRGDFSLTVTIGLTFSSVVAIFLVNVWGGYVSARLARGGIGHGIGAPILTIILLVLIWGVLVLARVPQRLDIPFTPTTMSNSLKEGFAPLLAIGAILAVTAKLIAGAIGGVYARRKNILDAEEKLTVAEDFLATPPAAPPVTPDVESR